MAQVLVAVASVTGTARDIANEIIATSEHIIEVEAAELIRKWNDDAENILLIITSTTGAGDIPPPLNGFHQTLTTEFPRIAGQRFALIALGDSSYSTFAEAGNALEHALEDIGAVQLCQRLTLDATEHFEPNSDALAWFNTELSQYVG
ncbi:flavodoxin domain-containing protein [uncultured Umboniibacter sp.]|uniref:flavodoxin domain-containing protein n=1 Tax=uncultured Umboniibacter sp. TaxID=1798917 RepID=UPI00261DFE73|nr:flavodoxin domain-containing protein [uncultured Umboniibacter sp.]